MKHLDLFSGIGGFAYAVDQVWPEAEHIFCDNDLFCQQVLKKHWPNSKIYGDIRTVINKDHGQVDILTGGFPCQPFSQAGQRRGDQDDRYLWPEMLRVIKEFKPTWVIGENVAGIVNMALEQVCLDLEGEGYEVWPLIIPACAINAPHRRDRVWIIGYAKHIGFNGSQNGQGSIKRSDNNKKRADKVCEPKGTNSLRDETVADSTDGSKQGLNERPGKGEFRRSNWEQNWFEVATEFCGVDDGLPVELDGFKLSKSQNRIQRIKALGNSIVPEIAIEILKGIKLCSKANS